MSTPGNDSTDAALAIRKAVRRVSWIGGISVGFSPWVYAALIVLLDLGDGLYRLRLLIMSNAADVVLVPETFQNALLLLSKAVCIGALPLACVIQFLSGRMVASKSENPAKHASNLSAVGIVSLTVVHTPAVFGLLYYLVAADVTVGLAMELWAFVTYLPMQWFVNRQIRALSHTLDYA